MDQADYPNALAMQPIYPNLIVTRTFSKLYGLAGLRIGYGVAHPNIVKLLNRVRLPFNINLLALHAAEAALYDDDHIQNSRLVNQYGKAQLQQAFARLGLSWISANANFFTLDCQAAALTIYQRLLQEGVIVRPLQNYAMPNYLRITIGTAEENTYLIKTLEKVLLC
jgi:histidinol-phosphate aminotransferase